MSLNTLRNSSDAEPGLILAGVLALLVHLAFIALMIFGLNWKTQPPTGMVVDLWQELPQPIQPPVKTTPPKPVEPKPAPAPEPPKPEPKQEPKPEPQKVVAPPPVKKPEPPVKDKKPDLEEQKKKELEKKELEKKEQAEKQRLQNEKAAKQKQEQEAKAQREAQTQREAQQAAARSHQMNEIDKYKAMIITKIKSRTVMPPDLPGNPAVEFTVTLLPGGDILDVRLLKSSGFATFDSAVERAIFLSKPLPVPPDPSLFNAFRSLNIKVHYLE